MKFCPKCGAELKEGAKFCPACGSQIPEEQTTQAPPPPAFEPQAAVNAFTDTFKGNTNIVQRVINILTKPKQEWLVVNNETPNTTKLIFGYALILALIPAIASFIAYGLIGQTVFGYTYRSIPMGISQALVQFFSAVIGVYLLAWVIDLLAPSFDSEKNFGKSLQLSVYASTAQWVAGILLLIPVLKWFSFLVGLYAIYLIAVGMPIMKKTPQPKVVGYVVVTILAMLVIGFLIAMVFGLIFGAIIVGSAGARGFGM